MKHLIILVLATLSLNQNAKALGDNPIKSELPNFISQIDYELPSQPFVITKIVNNCIHCDYDMQPPYLIFKDTEAMNILKDITGFDFQKLSTKVFLDNTGEIDREYQKIMKSTPMNYGHHRVNWILEEPHHQVIQKYSPVNCQKRGYYIPEECEYITTKTCQLIKSQTVKMRVHHHHKIADNTYTEFQGIESKVIREWEIPMSEPCTNNIPN